MSSTDQGNNRIMLNDASIVFHFLCCNTSSVERANSPAFWPDHEDVLTCSWMQQQLKAHTSWPYMTGMVYHLLWHSGQVEKASTPHEHHQHGQQSDLLLPLSVACRPNTYRKQCNHTTSGLNYTIFLTNSQSWQLQFLSTLNEFEVGCTTRMQITE